MNIELNDEAVDIIVAKVLEDTAKRISEDIHRTIREFAGSPQHAFLAADIQNHIEDLMAVNRVIDYFGGNTVNWTGYNEPIFMSVPKVMPRDDVFSGLPSDSNPKD